MMRSRVSIGLAAWLLLAACAQSGGGKAGSAAGSDAIVAPGKDWAEVGGAQVNGQSSDVIIVPNFNAGEPDDFTLSLHFGMAVAAYGRDGSARAGNLTLANDGVRPETAYAINGLDAPADSVEVALAFIAKLHPSRKAVRARLLNGPGTHYVGQFDFMTDAGARRIYVDLTPWADAIKAGA